jgi:hypothetical protein
MKKFIKNSGLAIGLSIAALLAPIAPAGAAGIKQPPSPVGVWDCIMTGNGQDGIIFLNFTDKVDTNSGLPTFEGLFVQAGHKKLQTGRDGSQGVGRTPSTPGGIFTNLFGGGYINGSAGAISNNGTHGDWLSDSRGHRGNWFYNSKGQTVGSYYTVLNAKSGITNYFETCIDEPLTIPLTNGSFNIQVQFCFTNATFVTNYPWVAPGGAEFGFTNLTFTNFNFTLGTLGITNNVSFTGKIVPGKRLTMVGTSAFGRFTIRGVPLIEPVATFLPVDGFYWTGSKIENGFRFQEEFGLFDVTDAEGLNLIPNVYAMSGQGPSYTYGTDLDLGGELCLISKQKRIGFSISEIPFGTTTNSIVSANVRGTYGPLKNTKKAISTTGQGSSTADDNVIKFEASVSPYAVPTPP